MVTVLDLKLKLNMDGNGANKVLYAFTSRVVRVLQGMLILTINHEDTTMLFSNYTNKNTLLEALYARWNPLFEEYTHEVWALQQHGNDPDDTIVQFNRRYKEDVWLWIIQDTICTFMTLQQMLDWTSDDDLFQMYYTQLYQL